MIKQPSERSHPIEANNQGKSSESTSLGEPYFLKMYAAAKIPIFHKSQVRIVSFENKKINTAEVLHKLFKMDIIRTT